MALTEFEHILSRAIGLDPGSIGLPALERAVRIRQAVCKSPTLRAYAEHLERTPAELQELIETVVIPETWFFRDVSAFSAMIRTVRDGWLREKSTGLLRLLSLPCSTGEEPATMAMALLDAGIPAERFHIDAVDVSGRAIAHARRGIYRRNSFRGRELSFRQRYFAPVAEGHQLAASVQQQITFVQANLLNPGFLPGKEVYAVVFCRNMLIYFDEVARKRAVEVLRRLMMTDGTLFVGPSETNLLFDHNFVSEKIPNAFALRQASSVIPFPPTKVEPAQPQPRARRTRPAPCPTPALVPTSIGSLALKLDEILRIADEGKLAEAAIACEKLLLSGGPSSEVFHVLGVIRDAAADSVGAASCYRKTLYLDPHHREALLHLALLLAKQGDVAGAEKLKERIKRLTGREGA